MERDSVSDTRLLREALDGLKAMVQLVEHQAHDVRILRDALSRVAQAPKMQDEWDVHAVAALAQQAMDEVAQRDRDRAAMLGAASKDAEPDSTLITLGETTIRVPPGGPA